MKDDNIYKRSGILLRENNREIRALLESLGFRNNETLNSDSYAILARLPESPKRYIVGLPETAEEADGIWNIDDFIKEQEILDCGKDIDSFFRELSRRIG